MDGLDVNAIEHQNEIQWHWQQICQEQYGLLVDTHHFDIFLVA